MAGLSIEGSLRMSLAPLLDAAPAIPLRAFAAMAAFVLGLVQFAAPKGTLAAPDDRLDLGGADGGGGRIVVLDSPDSPGRPVQARSICCRSSPW
jgi:hypothetical protein